MAERFAPGDYDQLHHFIADGIWDAAPFEAELLIQADDSSAARMRVLVIDDTAMPKKGHRFAGVAPQYASTLGKTANCQTLVSLTLARRRSSGDDRIASLCSRELDDDPAQMKRAGVCQSSIA